MSRYFFAFLVLAALYVPSFHANAQAAPARQTVDPVAARVIELINQERAAARLAPLSIHPVLMAEAQRFSGVQAELGMLSHRGIDNTTAGQRLTRAGYRWSFYGENLAAGQDTPEAAVAGWMASPSHRATMLNPKAREIGIGLTIREDDPSGYVNYWVMEVGRRR